MRHQSFNALTVLASVASIGMTSLFLPWAIWISKDTVRTRIELAVISSKLKITPEEYDAYLKKNQDSSYALPVLPLFIGEEKLK